MLGKFRHLDTDKMIYVATTRLIDGTDRCEDRFIQARQLASDLKELDNLVVAGDFYDEPDSSSIHCMRRNWYNRAFETSTGLEAPFTTFQSNFNSKDPTPEMRTADYVFFKSQACIKSIQKYLDIANQTEFPPDGFPSQNHPSDHFALGFEFVV